MDAPEKTTVVKEDKTTPIDPNIHLYQFLNDNDYEINVEALTAANPFIEGAGFVLTEKPLLVIKVTKKGDK